MYPRFFLGSDIALTQDSTNNIDSTDFGPPHSNSSALAVPVPSPQLFPLQPYDPSPVCSTSLPGKQLPPKCTTLHRFREFPPEIRIKIWQLAAVTPGSLVAVNDVGQGKKEDGSATNEVKYEIPSILHATFESREEAIKCYTPSFKNIIGRDIYFNPSKDTLYLANEDVLNRFCTFKTFLADVRYLTVSSAQVNENFFLVTKTAKTFRNLKEIVILKPEGVVDTFQPRALSLRFRCAMMTNALKAKARKLTAKGETYQVPYILCLTLAELEQWIATNRALPNRDGITVP